jgi:hypothetical protein
MAGLVPFPQRNGRECDRTPHRRETQRTRNRRSGGFGSSEGRGADDGEVMSRLPLPSLARAIHYELLCRRTEGGPGKPGNIRSGSPALGSQEGTQSGSRIRPGPLCCVCRSEHYGAFGHRSPQVGTRVPCRSLNGVNRAGREQLKSRQRHPAPGSPDRRRAREQRSASVGPVLGGPEGIGGGKGQNPDHSSAKASEAVLDHRTRETNNSDNSD